MTVATRLVGLARQLSSPAAISGLQAWYEADQMSVASVQPNTIAGLQLWLKADALVLNDGDPVATWTDSSGNGYDATGSPTKPTYKTNIVNGLPIVRFNGTTNFMKLLSAGFLAATANVTGITVFAVVNATSNGVQKKVLHISTNATGVPRFALQADTSNHWDIAVRRLDADSTTTLAGTTALPSAFQVVSGQCNYNPRPGTGVWLQGANDARATTLTSAGSTSNTSSADAFIGSGSTTPTNPFNGDIAEVIVYNVSLTNQQRLAVEKYLCTKYALTAIGCPYVNGDVVQTWKDLSGNGIDLIQNTAASKPIYETAILNGKPTVRFDGSASYMPILPGTTLPATLPQPFTYVIVAQENNLAVDTNNFMDCGSPTSVKFSGTYNTHPTNPNEYLIDSGTGVYNGTNADTNWHVYMINWNSPNSIGRKDGVTQVGPADTGALSASVIHVGATNAPSKFFHGDFAAALLYSRGLTNAELNLLGNYYASKYALSWTPI